MNSFAVVFGNTGPHLCVIVVLVTDTLEQHESIRRLLSHCTATEWNIYSH